MSIQLIRCFIAIELPDDFRKALAELQSALGKGRTPFMKWVEPSGIHLTLKFLGSVAADTIDEITLAMEETVKNIAPFLLRSSNPGLFPNASRTKIIWVGLTGDLSALTLLLERLESNLEQLGFPRESRAFTPHLTLARVRDDALPEERLKIGNRLMSAHIEKMFDVPVLSISLIKSQLTPGGAIYSRLAKIDLNHT